MFPRLQILLLLPPLFSNYKLVNKYETCDWDIYDCSTPYDLELTDIFRCNHDDCPVNFKCCSHKCFRHNICQPPKDVLPTPEPARKRLDVEPEECDLLVTCDAKLPLEFTTHFRCYEDSDCPSRFKCCYVQCYQHKVCQPATEVRISESDSEVTASGFADNTTDANGIINSTVAKLASTIETEQEVEEKFSDLDTSVDGQEDVTEAAIFKTSVNNDDGLEFNNEDSSSEVITRVSTSKIAWISYSAEATTHVVAKDTSDMGDLINSTVAATKLNTQTSTSTTSNPPTQVVTGEEEATNKYGGFTTINPVSGSSTLALTASIFILLKTTTASIQDNTVKISGSQPISNVGTDEEVDVYSGDGCLTLNESVPNDTEDDYVEISGDGQEVVTEADVVKVTENSNDDLDFNNEEYSREAMTGVSTSKTARISHVPEATKVVADDTTKNYRGVSLTTDRIVTSTTSTITSSNTTRIKIPTEAAMVDNTVKITSSQPANNVGTDEEIDDKFEYSGDGGLTPKESEDDDLEISGGGQEDVTEGEVVKASKHNDDLHFSNEDDTTEIANDTTSDTEDTLNLTVAATIYNNEGSTIGALNTRIPVVSHPEIVTSNLRSYATTKVSTNTSPTTTMHNTVLVVTGQEETTNNSGGVSPTTNRIPIYTTSTTTWIKTTTKAMDATVKTTLTNNVGPDEEVDENFEYSGDTEDDDLEISGDGQEDVAEVVKASENNDGDLEFSGSDGKEHKTNENETFEQRLSRHVQVVDGQKTTEEVADNFTDKTYHGDYEGIESGTKEEALTDKSITNNGSAKVGGTEEVIRKAGSEDTHTLSKKNHARF